MSAVVIAGDTSGAITLQAPAVSGTTTVTIPATTGNFLLDTTTGVCRAWVNFNGTGTVAIRASYNVSSITDLGTAYYRINFTSSISDVNFSVSGCAGSDIGGGNDNGVVTLSNRAVSSLTILTRNVQSSGGAVTDYDSVNVSVFR
jgi:hypothetical protein